MVQTVTICRHATLLVLNDHPLLYKSFVQSSAMTENADMVPEPAFMSNIMFKPTYGHMTFSPPDGCDFIAVCTCGVHQSCKE